MVRLIDDTASLPASVELVDGCLVVATGGAELGRWSFSDLSVEERPGGFLVAVEGEQLLVSPLDRRGFSAALDTALSRHAAATERAQRRRSRFRRRRRTAPSAESAEPDAPEEEPEPVKSESEESEVAAAPAAGRWWRRRDLPPVPGEPADRASSPETRVAVEPSPTVRVDAAPTADRGVAKERGRRTWLARRDRDPAPGRPEPEPAPPGRSAGDRVAGILDRLSLRGRLAIGGAVAVVLLAVFLPIALAFALLAVGGAALLLGALAYLDPYTAVRIPAPWTAQRLMALGGGLVVAGIAVPLLPI